LDYLPYVWIIPLIRCGVLYLLQDILSALFLTTLSTPLMLLLADQLVSELDPSFRCFVQASVELASKFISDLLMFS
jgi:hypothetical protein